MNPLLEVTPDLVEGLFLLVVLATMVGLLAYEVLEFLIRASFALGRGASQSKAVQLHDQRSNAQQQRPNRRNGS